MRTTTQATLALLALLTLGATRAPAQTTCNTNPCSLNNTASVTVGTVLRLNISSTTTALTAPNEAAFDAGFQTDVGPVLGVKANRAWTLKVSANASTWTAANGANASKGAGDLQWATASGGSYNPLSTSPATLLSGANGTGNTSQTVYYKTLWSYSNDTPGDYSLVVVYTLSAP